MSENEFELYLSLLSRFLRLKPEQRAAIADELRDHLEERMEDLIRRGLSREQAVRRALDEFGDASELAAHFTSLARRRRRRLIMRWTFGTIGVTAALLFVGLFMWNPNPADQGPPPANAQQHQAAEPAAERQHAEVTAPTPESAVEAKLKKRIGTIDFQDMPLTDALEYISDQIEVDIVINQVALAEEGLSTEEPVTLKLKYADAAAATVLDLILENLNLKYTIRDGFVYVQTELAASDDLQVRVYDVADLLRGVESIKRPASQPGGFGGGFGAGAAGPAMLSGMGVAPEQTRVIEVSPAEQLIEVLQEATSGPWLETDGVGGTISEYGDMLVVRQMQDVHREIEEILGMLRKAADEREGSFR